LLHFELFKLVAAINHEALALGAMVKHRLDKRLAKGASAPGDQDGLIANIN